MAQTALPDTLQFTQHSIGIPATSNRQGKQKVMQVEKEDVKLS